MAALIWLTHSHQAIGLISTSRPMGMLWSAVFVPKLASDNQLGQTKVGVDVMEHRLPDHEPTPEGFSNLLAKYLTSQEQVLIEQRKKAGKEAVLNGLLQFWALKESIIKALGLGLRMELQSININCLESFDAVILYQRQSK
ncbi:hypothetical protein O181_070404 [Austropuccinia psidii MF-1]|uniref:holo-[acyl-carrier-protein] synthase n=1 Tax=Austropuccinia psidii MF-1 TaxID=1389203 RepID=A0A9Q3F167_9BASI|nr:hypothetical protein [Austropuccinia psidii MF-1]